MKQTTKTFSELIKLKSFEERYAYLRLIGIVGESTFGFDRFLNQSLYSSNAWKKVRDTVIVRDNGCDLSLVGYEIHGRVIVHHMNPISIEDIERGKDSILDPEFLVCVSHKTHLAIHYGDESLLPQNPIIRQAGDTSPWLINKNKDIQMAKRKDFPSQKEEVVVKSTSKNVNFTRVCVSNCQQVNVRTLPSRDSKIIFVAPKGSIFLGFDLDNGWTKVKEEIVEGREGYIASDFLKGVTNG